MEEVGEAVPPESRLRRRLGRLSCIALELPRASTMDATQALAVYELVAKGFAELGVSDPRSISRSFLLRDSCYAGQVWRCEGFQAIWFLDGPSVEFQDAAGSQVKTLSPVPEVERKAA